MASVYVLAHLNLIGARSGGCQHMEFVLLRDNSLSDNELHCVGHCQ
jgi:hypothetical protein